MAAILLWPIGALPAQSAPLPGLPLGRALHLDSVLGPPMRISALAGPDRQGYEGHAACISRAERPHRGAAERPADGTPGAPWGTSPHIAAHGRSRHRSGAPSAAGP